MHTCEIRKVNGRKNNVTQVGPSQTWSNKWRSLSGRYFHFEQIKGYSSFTVHRDKQAWQALSVNQKPVEPQAPTTTIRVVGFIQNFLKPKFPKKPLHLSQCLTSLPKRRTLMMTSVASPLPSSQAHLHEERRAALLLALVMANRHDLRRAICPDSQALL